MIEERVRANELDLGVVGGHGLGPGEECLAAGVLDELVVIHNEARSLTIRARAFVAAVQQWDRRVIPRSRTGTTGARGEREATP